MPWYPLALAVALQASPASAPPAWRLRYIDLHVTVDPASRRLDGLSTLVVDATPGAGELLLDLGDSMTVDSASVAPTPKPIVPADPADFASLFGNATFQRGPAVLVLLARELGARTFQHAVRDYVARHAGGTVRTEDFQRAVEQASGRSLNAFFAKWIRGTEPTHTRASYGPR
jgi:peptidase M1-like protein